MRLVVDMNLSPRWARVLAEAGLDAVHWSEVGDGAATDRQSMRWARHEARVVLTHDLDFSAALAATKGSGPSVVRIRITDVSPDGPMKGWLLKGLERCGDVLSRGAIVAIDGPDARIHAIALG